MSKSATRIHKHSVRRQDSSALGVGLGTCDESAMPCSENGRVSSNTEENSVPKSGTSQKFGHDSVSSMNSIDKTGNLKSVRAELVAHQRSAFGKGELSESTALHRGRPGGKAIGQRELMNFFAYETLVVVVAALVVVMLGLVMSLAHLHASFQDLEKNMRSAQQCCQRNEELFQDLAKELRATNGFAFANNNNHNHNNNNKVLVRQAQYLDDAEENRQSKRPSNRPKIPTRGITQGENAVPKFPQTQFQTSDETVTEGLESPVEDQLRDSGPSMGSPEMSQRLTIIENGGNDEQNGVVINDESFEIDEDIEEDFEEDDENSFENEDDDDVEEADDEGEDEDNWEQIPSTSKDEEFHLGSSSRLGSNSDEAVPGQESWGHSGEPFVEPSAPESLSKESQLLSRHVREAKSLTYTFDEMMKEIMKNMDERQKKLEKTYSKKLKIVKRAIKSAQKVAIQSDRFVWSFENSVDYQTHLAFDLCKYLHQSQNKWNTSFTVCRDRAFKLDDDKATIPFHIETDITMKKKKMHRLVLLSDTPGVFEVQQPGLYLVQFNVTIVDETYNHSLALFLNDFAMLSCLGGGFPCPHENPAYSKTFRICNIEGMLALKAGDKLDIRTLQPKTELRVEDHRMSYMRFVMLEPAKSERKGRKNKKRNKKS